MTELTAARLKELLRYTKRTGLFTWRVNRTRGVRAGDVAGCTTSQGYITICIAGKQYRAHRLAWLYTTGEWPKNEIDHRNGVRNDNRWRNLRDVTRLINAQNQLRPHPNNKDSKLLGVFRQNKGHSRWRARICVAGKRINLGSFSTKEEASAAYTAAKQQHHNVGV